MLHLAEARTRTALAFLALLGVLLPSPATAISTIRTFVNGAKSDIDPQEVHDLHVVYNAVLTGVTVLSGQAGSISFPPGGNAVDVTFNQPVGLGESVTIQASTAANKLDIKEWWWTKADHSIVVRQFTYVDARGRQTPAKLSKYTELQRGDEADLTLPKLDVYTIVNKSHHWGGAARRNQKITILMDVREFLDQRPQGMDRAKLLDNIQKAVKQWTDCTSATAAGGVPKAGQGGVPKNDGQQLGRDPAVMAPGPTHAGAKGEKFRSVTVRESHAAFVKYPKGLEIELITEPGDTRKPDIRLKWGIPAKNKGAIGVGDSEAAKGDKDRTGAGCIYIDPNRKWHLGTDTNGDGYIGNDDTDAVPKDAFDFYSVFKHELGHVISLNHAGVNFTPGDVRFAPPDEHGCSLPSNEHSPNATLSGDHEQVEPSGVLFSSDRPGGLGGLDLWLGAFDGGVWTVTNLGPNVNSSADEKDPFLAGDGGTLLFSSNRPGGPGGFDLYESSYDFDTAEWDTSTALGNGVNSGWNDAHPSMPADMRTLWFTSDRPGGFGGWDLWQAEWIEQLGFSQAFNPGDGLNSSAHEISPCISADAAALYFASDRLGGLGGLDLWRTDRDTTGWRVPENLASLNSQAHDTDPSIRSDEARLLFASNRPGGPGGFDLYEVEVTPLVPVPVDVLGTPQGAGSVQIVVQGPGGPCAVSVPTGGLASADAVAAALAAAVNASGCMGARGIRGASHGPTLLLRGGVGPGDVSGTTSDPGLELEYPAQILNPPSLPALPPWAMFAAAALLLVAGLRLFADRRGAADRPAGPGR